MLHIEGLLNGAKLAELNAVLDQIPFGAGQATGGRAGALIKNNLQADARHPGYPTANGLVVQALLANPRVHKYSFANKVTPIAFARYGAGQSYGDHVDAAVHPLPNMVVRTDVSFTIFLSGPDEYEGGELVIRHLGGEATFKCKAGDMVMYPTGVTHRVNAVRSGWRKVAIGWIQSLVASHEHREILFRLEAARDALLEKHGRSAEFELVNTSLENLLRLHVQP